MTPEECKRLQSMEDLTHLPKSPAKAYEALGGAINVEVAKRVAEALVGPSLGLASYGLESRSALDYAKNRAN